ncbi:MAG: nodulation protein NfeD [Gammaproteobacteria bacterium]|nr:nodulation protein NfeD [Gammaproteobacteria bacterium]
MRLVICALLMVFATSAAGAESGPEIRSGAILLLQIDGPIGPAVSAYVVQGVDRAEKERAALVILTIDTPGGLDSAMREIVKAINSSPVPIAGFVAPSGARAASAGTYILYASHIAAMAPGTNLGAATPVRMGAPALPKPDPDADEPRGEAPEETDHLPGSAMERKMVNDAVAYLRGLAKMRGRNGAWAEKAVREAASLPAEEALTEGVIDLVATDVNQLVRAVNGRTLELLGQTVQLHTEGAPLLHHEPDWRTRLLAVITNPNVAYVLMLLGIYGLIFEFSNPGAIIPGTVGAIALLLALFAFQTLPINYAGGALLLLGVALMVAEAFVPSFGTLGLGGVVAFVFGSVMLIDTSVPGFGISLPLIFSVAVVSALFFLTIIGMAIRAGQRPALSGAEGLLGSSGVAVEPFSNGHGMVRVHSELWQAACAQPLEIDQAIEVTAVDGLILSVQPKENTR